MTGSVISQGVVLIKVYKTFCHLFLCILYNQTGLNKKSVSKVAANLSRKMVIVCFWILEGTVVIIGSLRLEKTAKII